MKDIFIERQEDLLRIAVKENNILKECYIEEEDNEPVPGQIYKGIVKNIVPAIKCAFIDIGYKKNCYMYMDRKFKNTSLKKNDELLVEVIKESIGDKGPKVSNAISIAGRYSVLGTLDNELSFSKKLHNGAFIASSKENIKKPENIGITIRTNAEKVSIEQINDEIKCLYEIYEKLVKESKYQIKPKLMYGEVGVLDKILRDSLDEESSCVLVNCIEDFNYIENYIKSKTDINAKVVLHEEARSLFDSYGIEGEILSLRNNSVVLKSGGYIVIDRTEAMYVIDVNSGKNVKHSSIEKTALNTNMEAAKEISRQIRLRNLSGIILVDFIDITEAEHKKKILSVLEEGFREDKNKTVIYPFTELNLVQIARRRRGKNIYEYMEEGCERCKGRGKTLKLGYISSLIRNEVHKIHKEQGIRDIFIEINPIFHKEITEDILSFIKNIDALDKKIYVKYTDNMELFKIESLIFSNQIENVLNYKIYG